MVGSVRQITDKAHLKREGGFVSDMTLHRSVLTCSSTTSGYPGAGRRSKPLQKQKKRDTQCASLFLLVAEVGLVTTGSRGNVCEVVCWVRRGDIRRPSARSLQPIRGTQPAKVLRV